MAAIIKKIFQGYEYLFEEIVDPRTKDWVLTAKPYQILILLCVYLMFVLKWGPKWMKTRQAFNLNNLLIIYNGGQVLACTYVFVQAVYYAWGWDYKWICEPVDYSYSPNALWIARLTYYYFLLKIIDLFDTIFFVLRKKLNQVSFLHIYHHTGMVMLIWAAVTYVPGGHGTLVGVINTFVHIIMYSYYLLTVIKPSYKQSFWWKKYITQLQILQFSLCIFHMGYIVFKSDCGYPRWISAVFLPQNLFMLVLFIDFYIKAYVTKPIIKVNQNNNSNNNKYSTNKLNNNNNGYNKNHENNSTCKDLMSTNNTKCHLDKGDESYDITPRLDKEKNRH